MFGTFKSSYKSFVISMERIQEDAVFFQVLSTLSVAIFRGTVNEMTNTMMSHMHFLRKSGEEQVRREFVVEKNFTRGKRKNWRVKC